MGRTTCGTCGKVNPPWGHISSFSIRKLHELFHKTEVRDIVYAGESVNRTNWISALLMNFSGNPFGTYKQIEKCIYCENKLVIKSDIPVYHLVIAKIARELTKLQRRIIPKKPSRLYIVLESSAN